MKRAHLPIFLAGVLAGVLSLGAFLVLAQSPPAEAQTPSEQILLMRDMSDALRGIEDAIRDGCRAIQRREL